ncbi:sugar ABC transporter ATP-binding protein [Anaerobium acetethylicum]|uniref:Ribose transport system ATP-binding protein n=1 Tax=Anaerobium acetethylicum TaxID=1619234 RepID=A0A1D3TYG2_9FIRM|nr:sugar ABC transporter ATP-binding protein [Anaerobium acetethylicum]SCP99475.1 ribose transport system ATP-binding protein [Anaerobium acetethylicum]
MSLEIKNVSKHYGAVIAIKEANMVVNSGEVRAILGGNGSGKSTLAKVISGLVGSNSGEISFDGVPLDFSSPKDAKKHQVIMTSQELSLFKNLTVEENICICNLPTKNMMTNRKQMKERAKDILKRMQLESLMGKLVSELAPNQQYMVELAKAIVQEPRILIIDEITSALYREDVEIVDEIVSELKQKGCIILFISHRMAELYAMCDSVTIMRNGETVGTYPIMDKTEDEYLSLMIGSKIESYHGEGKHQEKSKRDIFMRANHIPIPSYHTYEMLEIGKGEIIGIAGLQGHGQTDLLQALYGGFGKINIELDGKKVTVKNAKEAVSHGFAYISGDRERDGTFSERNLTENLSAVQELVKHKKIPNAKKVLDELHVKYDNQNELITSLSGGNQQKIVVGRWLTASPRIIFADDPTKGIDVNARTDLHKEFAKIANNGNAVVMISSDDDELVSITSMVKTSKVIVMYEGHISAILEGNDINRENIFAAAMPINAIPEEKGAREDDKR